MQEPKALTSGMVLGEWKLAKRINGGGQGEVWEVRPADVRQSPPRAMKICIPSDEKAKRRFEREVRLLEGLEHPNIVPIFESSTTWNGRTKDGKELGYYVTERFDHAVGDLRWIHDAPLFALDVFRVVCDAVSHLHEQPSQVLHRDIKPSNVLLGSEPFRVALADLGIAAEEEAEKLTQTREVVGTPSYRAPEVMAGERGSVLSDVYSLGRLLEWLLVGKDPTHLEPRPTPVERKLSTAVREHLDEVVRKACSNKPSERYQSVRQLVEALRPVHADFMDQSEPTDPENSPTSPLSGSSAYQRTAKILQERNAVAWREQTKQERRQLTEALLAWRQDMEGAPHSQSHGGMSKLLALAAPCIASALAAAEYPDDAFGDGLALLRNLEHVPGWNPAGWTVLAEAPRSLICVAHNLLGATKAATGNVERAIATARFWTTDRRGEPAELWRVSELTAWPVTLGGNAVDSWRFLQALPKEHPWILQAFGELSDYEVALAAYWWILSFTEFASELAAGRAPSQLGENFHLDVPPLMLLADHHVHEHAWKIAFPAGPHVSRAAAAIGVDPARVRTHWPEWAATVIKYATKMGPDRWLRVSDFRVPVLPQ